MASVLTQDHTPSKWKRKIFFSSMCGLQDLSSQPGSNPCPLHWELRISTTGPQESPKRRNLNSGMNVLEDFCDCSYSQMGSSLHLPDSQEFLQINMQPVPVRNNDVLPLSLYSSPIL